MIQIPPPVCRCYTGPELLLCPSFSPLCRISLHLTLQTSCRASCKSCLASPRLCSGVSHHVAALWLRTSHLLIPEFKVTAVNMKLQHTVYLCSVKVLFPLCICGLLSELSACLRLYRVYSSSYLAPWGCFSALLCYITLCVLLSLSPWSYIISLFPLSVSYSLSFPLSLYAEKSPSLPIQRCRVFLSTLILPPKCFCPSLQQG